MGCGAGRKALMQTGAELGARGRIGRRVTELHLHLRLGHG